MIASRPKNESNTGALRTRLPRSYAPSQRFAHGLRRPRTINIFPGLKVMKKNILFLLAIISFGNAAFADIRCADLKYGSVKYHENMEALAKQAHLKDNYYSRYHEDAVKFLCAGETQEIRNLVDEGSVKSSEIEAIKNVLGKDDRSEQGQSYGYSKQKFLEIGLCSSCADNVAQYYTKSPASRCGKLAKQVLEGNPGSTEELKKFPSYCIWKYEAISENQTRQEKRESSASNEQLGNTKSHTSEAKFIHPLDFDGSDIQKKEVIAYIQNRAKKDYCKTLDMCQETILRMMEKENLEAFKRLTRATDRKILDRAVHDYCGAIDMCTYQMVEMMYNENLKKSTEELSWQ